MSGVGFKWSVDPVTVDEARPRRGQVPVPNFIRVFRKLNALEFAFASVVEQTKFDLGGVGGKQSKIYPQSIPSSTERERLTFADSGAPQALRRLRQ